MTYYASVCNRDITFVVEDNANRPGMETSQIVIFLQNVVRNIQIGKNANLVSLSTFDRGTHERIHFETDQTDVLRELANLNLGHSVPLVDYEHVIHDLDSHIGGRHDPRHGTKNVVVMLIDKYAQSGDTHHNRDLLPHFHGEYDTVTVNFNIHIVISPTDFGIK